MEREVVLFEEPVYGEVATPHLSVSYPIRGLTRLVPYLPNKAESVEEDEVQAELLSTFIQQQGILRYDVWYYTPMALPVTRELKPEVTVFDCMDELSGFLGAPKRLKELERNLLNAADVVFTGGASLYEAKRSQHSNVYCCPSSIDRDHFAKALHGVDEPSDQARIPGPRVGFYGVIDERLNVELLRRLALLRPDLQFIVLGPIVKISEDLLPRLGNIHYLGKRGYEELPAYLSGWDVAMLPFAHNEATRFISPTKTPEYLAAGRPVVSTGIKDVVRPYGELGLISIAESPEEFSRAIDFELLRRRNEQWQNQVSTFLSTTSWDATWSYMSSAIETVRAAKSAAVLPATESTGRYIS